MIGVCPARGHSLRMGVGRLCALAILLAFAPRAAEAQQVGLAADLVGGPALPVGNTARASGAGMSVGFGILHRLGSRVHLTTDFALSRHWDGEASPSAEDQMSGTFGTTTDLDMWRATVGLMVRVTDDASPWRLRVRGGFGVAGIGSGALPPGSQEPTERSTEGLNEDVVALTGGLELSRSAGSGSSFEPFVRIQADAYDLKDWLVGLALLNPEIPRSGWLVSVPVQVGVRIGF